MKCILKEVFGVKKLPRDNCLLEAYYTPGDRTKLWPR